MEKELNKNVVIATVEDWTGRELVRFEGKDSAWMAIDWKEESARMSADREVKDINSEEWEDFYNGASEDLYVIGYDKDGNKTGVEFG